MLFVFGNAEADYHRSLSAATCENGECILFVCSYSDNGGIPKLFTLAFAVINQKKQNVLVQWEAVDRGLYGGVRPFGFPALIPLVPGEKKEFFAKTFEIPEPFYAFANIFDQNAEGKEYVEATGRVTGFSTQASIYIGNPVLTSCFAPKSWQKP